MKICFLADATSTHTRRWANYFSKLGHETHVVTYEAPLEPFIGSKLHVVNCRFKNMYLAFPLRHLKVINIIKQIEPDIIHAHFVSKFGFHGALLNLRPFVISAWGSDILIIPQLSKYLYYFTKFSLKRAQLITCDGDNLKNAMKKMGINGEKIRIVQHGVDSKKFAPMQTNNEIRHELNASNSPLVISTRRLEKIYGIDTLIYSIPLVLKEVANTKFIIVGDGNQKKNLIELAHSLKISHAVIFVGRITHEILPKYLASSDIYVSTSLSDGGVALSTLEAMSCGLPVITTETGDSENVIKYGKNGFTISKKDYQTLAQKIIYLLENEETRSRMRLNNRKTIQENYEYCQEMKKMDTMYHYLIKECET